MAIENLTATTLRNIIGELNLDQTLTLRETINAKMLFIGSPGTGKMMAARIMAGFLYQYGFIRENKFLETDGNFLKASTAADTAAKTELVLREAAGGVLFIDEAYTLAMCAAGEASTATLMKRMEDDRGMVVILLAGYTDEMQKLVSSNPGFASRFRDCIEFPDYTDQELCEIFRLMAGGKGVCLSAGPWSSSPYGSLRKRNCRISGMPGQCGRSLMRLWTCMRSTCRTGHCQHRNGSSFPQPTSWPNRAKACSVTWAYKGSSDKACGRGKNGPYACLPCTHTYLEA